jgi:ribose transport system permease protein
VAAFDRAIGGSGVKVNERTGDVTHRRVLKKNKVTRRHRVVDERVERTKKVDSRFDTRRSPIKWKTFHPRNIGVVYLYALIWAVFMVWVPDTWLTWLTHRSVLNQNAILVVIAIGLLVPLSAGVFDLSIAGTVSASSVTVGWLLVDRQWSVPLAIVVALLVGVIVGNINGFLVVKIRIDSFIATLGMSSILTAYAVWRSGNRSILGFPESFKGLTDEFVWGVNKTVVLALVLAFALWFVFEHTAAGRYLFATGGARDAARLAGVQTDRYVWGSLVTSATFAALGGVLVASQFGSTTAQTGAPYLLPAFAAAFLGSTQFKRRFNVWGAVLAVFVLQSGVKGLQLAGIGTTWLESLFFGVALIVAVGFSSFRRRVHGGERRWWRREESGPEHFLGKLLGWGKPKTEQSKANANEWWFDPEDSEGHHIKPT